MSQDNKHNTIELEEEIRGAKVVPYERAKEKKEWRSSINDEPLEEDYRHWDKKEEESK